MDKIASKDQLTRFIETAKALECDEDEARFKKLGRIGNAKLPAGPKTK